MRPIKHARLAEGVGDDRGQHCFVACTSPHLLRRCRSQQGLPLRVHVGEIRGLAVASELGIMSLGQAQWSPRSLSLSRQGPSVHNGTARAAPWMDEFREGNRDAVGSNTRVFLAWRLKNVVRDLALAMSNNMVMVSCVVEYLAP